MPRHTHTHTAKKQTSIHTYKIGCSKRTHEEYVGTFGSNLFRMRLWWTYIWVCTRGACENVLRFLPRTWCCSGWGLSGRLNRMKPNELPCLIEENILYYNTIWLHVIFIYGWECWNSDSKPWYIHADVLYMNVYVSNSSNYMRCGNNWCQRTPHILTPTDGTGLLVFMNF